MYGFDGFFHHKSILRFGLIDSNYFHTFLYFSFSHVGIVDGPWIHRSYEFLMEEMIIDFVGIVLITVGDIDEYNVHDRDCIRL